jgi:hypothetical protein
MSCGGACPDHSEGKGTEAVSVDLFCLETKHIEGRLATPELEMSLLAPYYVGSCCGMVLFLHVRMCGC